MDLKQIKELIAIMEKAGIKKLSIKQKSGDELHLERHEENGHHALPPPPPAFYPPAHGHSKVTHEEPHQPKEDKPGKFVTSPLVGTFYKAASPDDPAFVKVGDKVAEGTVICIIEAMKVMNEVKAGMSGTVAEILVENAHPVEFGTKLIRIT